MYTKIAQIADAMSGQMIGWRRDFHHYPETALLEMRTASLVARRLSDWGYKVTVGEKACDISKIDAGLMPERLRAHYERALKENPDPEYIELVNQGSTAVVGVLECGEGPTVGVHCELDSVPVTECDDPDYRPNREGFASTHPGMAHSCGHDANLAAMLGTAKALSEIREHLQGRIKFIFKPADERGAGAAILLPMGHLDDVDYLFSTHLFGRELGVPGADVMANFPETMATGKLEAVFHGTVASGSAYPNLCKSVIVAMSTAVSNLQGIPRHGDGVTRIQVTRLSAGEKGGGMPERGEMSVSYCGKTTAIRQYMEESAIRILKTSAEMHEVDCEVRVTGGCPPIVSDEALASRMERVANEHDLGVCVRYVPNRLLNGADDFAFMMERVREHGGLATDTQQITDVDGVVHTGRFDYDESVIPKTAKAFAATIYDILKQKD